MSFERNHLSRRLNSLDPEYIEAIYANITEIEVAKRCWQYANTIPASTIEQYQKTVRSISAQTACQSDNQANDYKKILEQISKQHQMMPITESTIIKLHQALQNNRTKTHYKSTANNIELDSITLKTLPPHLVKRKMKELIAWYNWAIETYYKHPLILIANMLFEYTAIHPFQTTNHQVGLLLANLVLVKQGYACNNILSYEEKIEEYKEEYHEALLQTHASWKKATEEMTPYILFFLEIMKMQALDMMDLLEQTKTHQSMPTQQQEIWQWIGQQGKIEFTSQEIRKAFPVSLRTIERCIKKLVETKHIEKLGKGRESRYIIR